MATKKLPAFQFYPGDWMKDPNLRRCTHAAKGVWMDLLCLMFESEERGVLATSGQPWSDEEIALAVGGDQAAVLACIQELTLKGVANRQGNGAIYSKRLVRDEHKRRLCVAAGKKGGNPQLVTPLKGSSKGQVKGESKGDANRNPTPSSSVSTSSSEETPNGVLPGAEKSAPGSPTILVFPTVGKGPSSWDLTERKIAEYRDAFPGVDVLAECKKALQWVRDNPPRTKTASGMASFLNKWLTKTQNRGGSNGSTNFTGRTDTSRRLNSGQRYDPSTAGGLIEF